MTIDWWTLALQTVNVLVLVWILGRFFFRPVMAIMAKRQDEANKLMADAAAARKQAAEIRAAAESERAGILAEKGKLTEEASVAAQKQKAELLATAAAEAAELKGAAKEAIERERADADVAIVASAADLSVEIGKRLISRVEPDEVLASFLKDLRRALEKLSAESRESLKSATAENPLAIITASPLSAAEQDSVRAILSDVLGSVPVLAFRVDPELVAGIEIEGRNVAIRNSWQSDLARIRQELADDRRHRQP